MELDSMCFFGCRVFSSLCGDPFSRMFEHVAVHSGTGRRFDIAVEHEHCEELNFPLIISDRFQDVLQLLLSTIVKHVESDVELFGLSSIARDTGQAKLDSDRQHFCPRIIYGLDREARRLNVEFRRTTIRVLNFEYLVCYVSEYTACKMPCTHESCEVRMCILSDHNFQFHVRFLSSVIDVTAS